MSSATHTPTSQRYGSLTSAAEYLGCSEKTIRRMISAGQITGYRLGKRIIRVDMGELGDLIRPIPSVKAG